jgi:hypothetical protein
MIVKLLMVENQPEGDDFIEEPTWDDIEEALNMMEGNDRTYIGLYKVEEPTDEEFLMVGGGEDGKNYVCTYYNRAKGEYTVVNQHEKDPDGVIEVPIGQVIGKRKKFCNDLKDIIQPVKYFYESGTMSPDVKWEKL